MLRLCFHVADDLHHLVLRDLRLLQEHQLLVCDKDFLAHH
jgi:hypothetical protein